MRITPEEFRTFSVYVKDNFGINLTDKKKTLVTSRLNSVVEKHGYESFTAYFNHVASDASGKSVIELLNRITTNHTFFYREKKHFEFLQEDVLPELVQRERHERDLRIWSAGCSSGEEPYTLAMILSEFLGPDRRLWDTKILATDISTSALLKAKAGVYAKRSLEELPALWRVKYLEPYEKEFLRVSESLRGELILRRFNLMNPFPFKRKFHVIFCRNVMIYFDAPTKAALVEKFHRHLEPGGYLFIGHSESIDRSRSDFRYIRPAVYRKDSL